MFDITKKSINWGGRKLTLESGRIARQAHGAVLATYGETVVLCTVVAQKEAKPGIDFFPLTVNYQEKYFAAGKIPGGFMKREGKNSEKETLTSRLIDRPIRPLFHPAFRNETQVICTVLSHDQINDPDVVAMVGASAALTISGIPFLGPIGAARVGYIDGQYVLNPTYQQLPESKLDLVVACTQDSVMMVESEAYELSEEQMLGAVVFGHEQMQPVIDLIINFAEQCAKEPWDVADTLFDPKLVEGIEKAVGADLRKAYAIKAKQERYETVSKLKKQAIEQFVSEDVPPSAVSEIFKDLESTIVRNSILETKKRIDGRGVEDVRPIAVEVGILPKTHGSALFTRGETQSICVTTLGTSEDEQIIDSLEGDFRETFMLHYNFPPYSVGEASPMRAPGRREIGHGKLAWRAMQAVIPTKEEFPYTIRIVSEITESNGSSSMATVCGSSLAMMDAGVPLKAPVAGIAMGLIKEGEKFAVLSDIMGDEDHLGDMDFKVAGTANGVTTLQMDIKINGITPQIMKIALDQAKAGRLHILGEMAKVLSESRPDINDNAPRITAIKIPVEKIREVIGSGGSVIRKIVEDTGAKIDIEDDGTVRIAAVKKESGDAALAIIQGIIAEPEIGKVYSGKVVRIVDFGAFVNFLGSRDGLVHISELANTRVAKVTDVLNEGDEVKVLVTEIDPRGKVKLSYRLVDQETGEDLSGGELPKAPKREREDRGDRGGRDRRDRGERGDRDSEEGGEGGRFKRRHSS